MEKASEIPGFSDFLSALADEMEKQENVSVTYVSRTDVETDIRASEAAEIEPSLRIGWYWLRLHPLEMQGPFTTEAMAWRGYKLQEKKEKGE